LAGYKGGVKVKIIGRKEEMRELERYYNSGQPELLVVHGRRRVGKTFLIREYFENNFAFYFTGNVGASNSVNLSNFDKAILKYGGKKEVASTNWYDAFSRLEELLKNVPSDRKVVFIDEMPWLDTRR